MIYLTIIKYLILSLIAGNIGYAVGMVIASKIDRATFHVVVSIFLLEALQRIEGLVK